MIKKTLFILLLFTASCSFQNYEKWKENAQKNGNLKTSIKLQEIINTNIPAANADLIVINNFSEFVALFYSTNSNSKMIAKFEEQEYAIQHFAERSYKHCDLPLYNQYGGYTATNCRIINIPATIKRVSTKDYRNFYLKYAQEIRANKIISYTSNQICAEEEIEESNISCKKYDDNYNHYLAFFFYDEKKEKKENIYEKTFEKFEKIETKKSYKKEKENAKRNID